MTEEEIYREAAGNVTAWYRRHGRDLPWRRTKNPYYIWVSEIMLQQTQVETVKPYYERFITELPTVEALAEADEQKVFKLWEAWGITGGQLILRRQQGWLSAIFTVVFGYL